MRMKNFNNVVYEQINYCKELLISKGQEYVGEREDRLSAYKRTMALMGGTQKQALAGLMAKHTLSIYDMCKGGEYSKDKWIEKITDHINYLLLLRAVVEEELNNTTEDSDVFKS